MRSVPVRWPRPMAAVSHAPAIRESGPLRALPPPYASCVPRQAVMHASWRQVRRNKGQVRLPNEWRVCRGRYVGRWGNVCHGDGCASWRRQPGGCGQREGRRRRRRGTAALPRTMVGGARESGSRPFPSGRACRFCCGRLGRQDLGARGREEPCCRHLVGGDGRRRGGVFLPGTCRATSGASSTWPARFRQRRGNARSIDAGQLTARGNC